jgi:hypothetical protein
MRSCSPEYTLAKNRTLTITMKSTPVKRTPAKRILKELKNPKITKKREELVKSICGTLDENDVYPIWLEWMPSDP